MRAASPARADGRRPVVLQVLPELTAGGVERGTIDVAEAIVASGGRCVVASAGGWMVKDIERAGAEHVSLPLKSKNPMVIRRNISRIAELVRDYGVEIVHARSRAPAWSALYAARRTGASFVTTFHGTYNLGLPFKKAYNSVMTRGDRVIAISRFIAEHMIGRYRTDPRKIRVIYRGADLEIFDPAKVPAARVIQLADQWRLPDGMPIIMLPGRLTRWKGQALLIEALARLGRAEVRCLLVGDDQGRTAYRRELERLIQRRGLGGVVHIVGPCRDMAAAYMLADVVVSASTDPEAFGRVSIEAQSMGKPVVASNHGASPELIIPEETGWLFRPGSPDALADALRRALDLDTGARESLAQSAMSNARTKFSKQRMCNETLGVYRELMTARAADALRAAG